MSTFSIFLILIVIVAFLLVVVIMVQNPKGGGLSSSFGGERFPQARDLVILVPLIEKAMPATFKSCLRRKK